MKHRMKKREGMAGDVAYGKVREGFTEEEIRELDLKVCMGD